MFKVGLHRKIIGRLLNLSPEELSKLLEKLKIADQGEMVDFKVNQESFEKLNKHFVIF